MPFLLVDAILRYGSDALHGQPHPTCAPLQETGELRHMSRTHIHFATAGRHMRRNAWADVLLQLDLGRALQVGWWVAGVLPVRCAHQPGMQDTHGEPFVSKPLQDGFKFSLALNGVLLCEGPLPVGYVRHIQRTSLPADWL